MRRHDGAPSATPTSTILADNDFRRRCLVIIARNAHRLPRWMIYAALCLTALAATIALTWWVYSPGLSGDFLFDDFGNLPVLGATGPVDNWATFWRYITSGNADPTGRPLPLLTFLIDAHNWPANPYPFKVTNVILHLINGALLAWVLWWLGKAIAIRHTSQNDIPPALRAGPLRSAGGENARWPAIAALFGAGAWLLHPLLVSTTLYIVQREAMLAATFVLLGTLGWIASRGALVHGHVRRALVGMALSAWFCTGLAVLSKANGALFPLELLLVEWIVLARQPMPDARTMRWHKRAVVVHPARALQRAVQRRISDLHRLAAPGFDHSLHGTDPGLDRCRVCAAQAPPCHRPGVVVLLHRATDGIGLDSAGALLRAPQLPARDAAVLAHRHWSRAPASPALAGRIGGRVHPAGLGRIDPAACDAMG
jgi:hypothetical protein